MFVTALFASGSCRRYGSFLYNSSMKLENPTSRDIAEIAGVSQATVSRALRNSPLVRKETRERVQQIARELNYFVNRNAAGLRTHQSNTIALLIFDETGGEDAQINPFFLSMLGHITRSAASLGYDVLISLQQLTDDWHVEYQASRRADGLILLGYGDYVEYREKLDALAAANTRFVIYGVHVDGQPGIAFGCDNEAGGYQATRHLLSLGRKRIVVLGDTTKRHPEFETRRDGYRRALEETGTDEVPELVVHAENTEDEGYRAIAELLRQGVDSRKREHLARVCRADRLADYGGPPTLTPEMNRVADEGFLFERALAPSPWTVPSVASMLTAWSEPSSA